MVYFPPLCPFTAPCCSLTSFSYTFFISPTCFSLCGVLSHKPTARHKREKKNQSIEYSSSFQGRSSLNLILIKPNCWERRVQVWGRHKVQWKRGNKMGDELKGQILQRGWHWSRKATRVIKNTLVSLQNSASKVIYLTKKIILFHT